MAKKRNKPDPYDVICDACTFSNFVLDLMDQDGSLSMENAQVAKLLLEKVKKDTTRYLEAIS